MGFVGVLTGMRMRGWVWVVWACVLGGATASVRAETTYRVACVSLHHGDLLWKSARADFPRPHLRMAGNQVVVMDAANVELARLRLDTGAVAPQPEPDTSPGPTAQAVTELPTAADLGGGLTLLNAAGRTLTAQTPQTRVALATLEAPILRAVAVPGFAVALLDGKAGLGLELLALHAQSRALAWSMDLGRRMPDLNVAQPAALHTDEADVVVAVDGWLARVEVATGRVVFTARLPKALRAWQNSGPPRVGRHGEAYVASFGDVLMVVGRQDGKVWAAYAGGVDSAPWPTVVEGRMLLTWTDQRTPPAPLPPPTLPTRPAVAVVTRDVRTLGGFMVEFVPLKDIHAREIPMTPLSHPPPPQTDQVAGERLVLHLGEPAVEGAPAITWRVDVTQALLARGRAVVRLGPQVEQLRLVRGTQTLMQARRPGPPVPAPR